ncbi:MAG TPA: ATP-binding protein [Miltoncostaeaceae bacterium]|nr:ATP-binding protein [Miltoncostaeaceae bacterium]
MGAPALDRAVHDLHGPLTVIRGLCLGLERCDRRAERRRTIALIDAEVLRIARGLAGLVAPDEAPAGSADLAVLARAAAERFAAVGRERAVTVRLLRAAAPAPVAGDPARLERALDNLMRNAVRHAGTAGTVTIRVSCADGRAEVRVRDGGRGVPAADREAIFMPGIRGSAPEGRGSGLGLAIAREIAEEHGGTLTLDAAGPGACFRLRLPLLAPSADDPRAA